MSDFEDFDLTKTDHEIQTQLADDAQSNSEDIIPISHEEEVTEKIDERWLISFADLMTLLFGLFILLYSMRSPETLRAIQNSIKLQFTNQEIVSKPETPIIITKETRTEIKKQIEVNAKINKIKEQVEDLKITDSQQKQKIQSIANTIKEKQLDINKKKDIIQSLREKIKSSKKIVADNKKMKAEIIEMKVDLKELEEAERKVEELKKDLKDKETILVEVKALKALLSSVKEFTTVVVNWPTENHDIDLSITDPKGKTFNFKNRKHKGHPGSFTLDSRKGPGAEMWQSSKLIPGKYKVDVNFYSPYGNNNKAQVKLEIHSTFGVIKIPEFKLDYEKNKMKSVYFRIKEDHTIEQVH